MKRLSYDLAERTAAFGEQMIEFCLGISATAVSAPIINQLIRAATSIGAKYCEADDTESKRDFRDKIGICRKESPKTKYWLRMIAQAVPAQKNSLAAFGPKQKSFISSSLPSFEPLIAL